MSSQTIDERIDEILRKHRDDMQYSNGFDEYEGFISAKQAIKALILEAEMAGMIQVQALFEDDPNPDAVRPLSSSQLRKLHEYVKQQLKGGE